MPESEHSVRLSEIQDQIGKGQYRVDTQAVADAIMRRLLQGAKPAVARIPPLQDECS